MSSAADGGGQVHEREPGTEIVVEARTADTEAGLGGQAFLPVMNGDSFSSSGRYIEVRVTLKASPGGISPVLSDIAVQPYLVEVDIDIKPGNGIDALVAPRRTLLDRVIVDGARAAGAIDFISKDRIGKLPEILLRGHAAQDQNRLDFRLAWLRSEHAPVAAGEFGADMQVSLVNDGPVTLILESPIRSSHEH